MLLLFTDISSLEIIDVNWFYSVIIGILCMAQKIRLYLIYIFMKKDILEKAIDVAVKEAYLGIKNNHGGPFGTVIFKGNKIIAKAHNEVVKNNDPTCHGEMQAIHKACKKLKNFDLSGCELYTTGEPCGMCLVACL